MSTLERSSSEIKTPSEKQRESERSWDRDWEGEGSENRTMRAHAEGIVCAFCDQIFKGVLGVGILPSSTGEYYLSSTKKNVIALVWIGTKFIEQCSDRFLWYIIRGRYSHDKIERTPRGENEPKEKRIWTKTENATEEIAKENEFVLPGNLSKRRARCSFVTLKQRAAISPWISSMRLTRFKKSGMTLSTNRFRKGEPPGTRTHAGLKVLLFRIN